MASRYRKYGATLCAGGLLALLLAGVCPERAQAQSRTVPSFEVDAVSARADAASGDARLDVYTTVPYAKLRFTSTANGFTARYDVTLEVFEVDGKGRPQNLIATRLWDDTVIATSYLSTRSSELVARTTQSLELEPGRYLLEVQLEDQATNEAFVRELPVEVRDLSGPVALSDLILIDHFDEETNTISPSVSGRVGTDAFGIQVFYEVYADRPQPVRITKAVIRQRSSGGLVRSVFGRNDDEADGEVSYTADELVDLQAGRNQNIVRIPTGGLKAGDYVVRLKLEDEAGRLLSQAEKAFTAEWTGLAQHIQDLDEAIAQLQYIAKGKDLRYIQAGATQAERLDRFQAFWEKRDPTPGTERNEKMEEYYYRVAHANSEYGSQSEGWKTDRGQVAVLFGEPDAKDRHPYNFDSKPYEVWYYYQIGRQFIFIDNSGFGDYDLLVPIWDERTRIR